MKASNLVAGVLAIAIVGGAAYGLTVSGKSMAAAPEMVCSSNLLTFPEQSDCKQQMNTATDQTARKQVAMAFESKIDVRKTAAGADTSGASTSSGGSTMTPSTPPAPAPDAAPTAPDSNAPAR